MVEYRRGVSRKRKNNHWHWHPDCESFPTNTFAIRQDRPSDIELCARCAACVEEMRPRTAA